MRHPNEPQREDAWLSVAEMCRVLDVTETAVRKAMEYVPERWIRRGKPTLVYCRGLLLLWAKRLEGEVDSDLSGSNSPALERFRAARADLAEREVAVQDGKLVLREQMQRLLTGASAILRRQGDLLVRRCGNDAGEILQEGIDDFEKLLQSEGFAGDTDGDSGA